MENILNEIKCFNKGIKLNFKFSNGLTLCENNADHNPNILTTYILANYAADWFLERIKELDKDHQYNRISGEVEVLSDEALKIAEKLYDIVIHDGYPGYNEALENKRKELKELHPEWWRTQPSLPNMMSLYKMINISYFDNYKNTITIEEAIQGYKAAKDILKEINNDDLTPFCTETKTMLNYEFKKEYDEEINKVKEFYHIPDKKEWIENLNLPKIKKTKTRMSLDRQPCSDIGPFERFSTYWYNSIN